MPRRGLWTLAVAALLLVSSPPGYERGARGSDGLSREAIVEVVRATNHILDGVEAQRIAGAVLRCEREQGLAPGLVLAVMTVESSMRPWARSPKGAMGLMQVMPHMFVRLDLPGPISHTETNVEAGCLLLADNIRRLGEDEGISAYFWGSRIGGEGYLQRVQAARRDLVYGAGAEEPRSQG